MDIYIDIDLLNKERNLSSILPEILNQSCVCVGGGWGAILAPRGFWFSLLGNRFDIDWCPQNLLCKCRVGNEHLHIFRNPFIWIRTSLHPIDDIFIVSQHNLHVFMPLITKVSAALRSHENRIIHGKMVESKAVGNK